MKRIRTFIIGAAILTAMLLGLTACGLRNSPAQTPREEATEPVPSASAALPAGEQRRILEENRSLWSFDEGEYAPDWYYAFTDLDHNGLLEVLSASTQGSGIFTYVHFYEVLPDGSGVRNLYHADGEIEGPDDWPEIILDTLPCYYDRAADRYYYVCSNSVRDGAWHGMTQLAAVSLKDGAAAIEYLAAEDVQQTGDGEQRTYTDGAGNPITEQDYNGAVEHRFAGMERSELKPDWIAVTPRAEPERRDGERFEAVIILEGMEETVQYEHVRNDALGFEMDYDYELFTRRSEADRECFVSVWDDADNPENYLEVTRSSQDAETVAASVSEMLSAEYEISRYDLFPLDRSGSCIRIDASEVKGGGYMPDHLQAVYIVSAADGCRVAAAHYAIESAEGFAKRFHYMMETFAVIAGQGGGRLTDEQALAAIRKYCTTLNPELESYANAGQYPVYWEISSSGEREIVVLFRSYTGSISRYYIDPVSGDAYVTEQVPGVTEGEQRTEETLNAWDYLD